jgi:hypothetical protein
VKHFLCFLNYFIHGNVGPPKKCRLRASIDYVVIVPSPGRCFNPVITTKASAIFPVTNLTCQDSTSGLQETEKSTETFVQLISRRTKSLNLVTLEYCQELSSLLGERQLNLIITSTLESLGAKKKKVACCCLCAYCDSK